MVLQEVNHRSRSSWILNQAATLNKPRNGTDSHPHPCRNVQQPSRQCPRVGDCSSCGSQILKPKHVTKVCNGTQRFVMMCLCESIPVLHYKTWFLLIQHREIKFRTLKYSVKSITLLEKFKIVAVNLALTFR